MPRVRPRKKDFKDILTLHSVQASILAVSHREQGRLQQSFDGQDHDEDNRTSHFFTRASAGLRALSIMLSIQSRGPYNQWQKYTEFFEISMTWPDRDFRHEYRCFFFCVCRNVLKPRCSIGRTTFYRLVHILEQNPIFQSTGRKPQRPVRYQLACFLLRYGTRGASAMQAAHKLGIGFGTVFLYCKHVVRAIWELGLDIVTWGDKERLRQVAAHVMGCSGIPDCVGMLDGSLVRLTEIPECNGFSFICRKKFPAVSRLSLQWSFLLTHLIY